MAVSMDIRWLTLLPKSVCAPITKDTGSVRAEPRVVSQGRQVISSEARVLSQDGKVLAHTLTLAAAMNAPNGEAERRMHMKRVFRIRRGRRIYR